MCPIAPAGRPGSSPRVRARRPRSPRGRVSSAMAMIASMSAGWPAKWTGMMALVRGVIAASTAAGSRLKVSKVDVGEHRDGVGLDHCRRRRDERVRRNDDLVLGADARRQQRDSQRDRAVDDGDAVRATVHRGEPLLELGDFLPVQPAPLAAAQRSEQPCFLGLAEDRPGRKRFRSDGRAAEEGQHYVGFRRFTGFKGSRFRVHRSRFSSSESKVMPI